MRCPAPTTRAFACIASRRREQRRGAPASRSRSQESCRKARSSRPAAAATGWGAWSGCRRRRSTPTTATWTGARSPGHRSQDGNLGTGASLPVFDLSVGTHTITMTAQDSDNNTVTDSITVTVFDGPHRGRRRAGRRAHLGRQRLRRRDHVPRQPGPLSARCSNRTPLSQTQPCPALGDIVSLSGAGEKAWGDLDCDGEITSRDNQALLRNVLQQNALSQTQPCSPLGDPVTATPAALPVSLRSLLW